MQTTERELDLEPHKQLDLLTRHSNEDGTVDVTLVDWEKNEDETVDVAFRRPNGAIETEQMDWPQHANDASYKFVRLIDQTPYTMATAEKISEETDIWLRADHEEWELQLPESPSKPAALTYFNAIDPWNLFITVTWIGTMIALTIKILLLV